MTTSTLPLANPKISSGRLGVALQQLLEIAERPVGRRGLALPARRQLSRRVSHQLPRVLVIVTVEA